MTAHSIENLRIRCGKFFGVVKDGVCQECGRKVIVLEVDVSPAEHFSGALTLGSLAQKVNDKQTEADI